MDFPPIHININIQFMMASQKFVSLQIIQILDLIVIWMTRYEYTVVKWNANFNLTWLLYAPLKFLCISFKCKLSV